MDLENFAPSVDIQAEMDAAPETPEVVEPTPEPQAETPPVEEAAHEPKTVPIAALSEARKQAKQLREQMEERDRNNAAAIAELNAKLERLANPPAPEPSFDENPAENLRQRQERLENEQRAWNEERQRVANETKQETEKRQVISYISSEVDKAETEFTAKTPDYMEAVNYLRSVSEKNLRAQGMTDANRIAQITHEQALNMAANSIQQGLNPAEVAYAFAKNYGYVHKVDATRQVKAMAEAQGRTQTMGNGKADTALSIAALSQMDDAELDAVISDNANWKKITRGL